MKQWRKMEMKLSLYLMIMCRGLFSAGLQVSQVDRGTIWASGLPDLSVLALRNSSPR